MPSPRAHTGNEGGEDPAGRNETAVNAAVAALSEPETDPTWPARVELARTLARMLDDGAGYVTAAVARELRATLESLRPEAGSDDDTGAFLDEISTPAVPAPARDPARPAQGDVRRRRGQGGAPAGVRADAAPAARRRRRPGD